MTGALLAVGEMEAAVASAVGAVRAAPVGSRVEDASQRDALAALIDEDRGASTA